MLSLVLVLPLCLVKTNSNRPRLIRSYRCFPASDRKNGIDSPGAAIYDLPVQVGSQSPSGRVPSEYEPLRFSGAGTEYEDMNGRQSVYQELQRPGKEEHEEPMYVVIN